LERSRTGLALILLGGGLVVVTFGLGWFFAPDIGVQGSTANPESEVVGVQGAGDVVVVNQSNTVWKYQQAHSYFDVTRLENGSVLAAYTTSPANDCGPFPEPCARTGVRIIDPTPTPRVVYEWSFPVRDQRDSEVHDAELLPSGEVVIADMEYERIFKIDPQTGARTYIWNASDYYTDRPEDPTEADWLHINDVDRISEGRYLISVRNKNQLVIVEEGSGVVEVVNKDGDRNTLYKQHNPQWLNETAILVADSENDRIVELHERNGRWEVAWSIAVANGVRFDWPRDADRLPNGNTLITDSANNRVVEVTRHGAVVRSYQIDGVPYESDRLPTGETVGGEVYTDVGLLSQSRSNNVPILTPLLIGLRMLVPLPFWVSEIHVAATAIAVLLIGVGIPLRYPGLSSYVARADSIATPLYRRIADVQLSVYLLGGVIGVGVLATAVTETSFTRARIGVGMSLILLAVGSSLPKLSEEYRKICRITSVTAGILTAVVLTASTVSGSTVPGLDVALVALVVVLTGYVAGQG
jgi:hypothetical protein